MNITFLVGNGFDIALGIKTSYSDFYEWYCPKKSEIEHVKNFRADISKEIDDAIPEEQRTWADFEIGLGKYSEKFTTKTVEQYLDCVEDAQKSIVEYLKLQEETFGVERYSPKAFEGFRQSIRFFYENLSDLEKEGLQSSFTGKGPEGKTISFITLNYTYTLEKILEKLSDEPFEEWRSSQRLWQYRLNKDVLHVHGKVDSFPILGVGEESQITKKELLDTPEVKQVLIKENDVKAVGKLWYKQADKMIDQSLYLCLYGVSLGASDIRWWKRVTQWLKANSARHIIVFWHEKEPPNGISSLKQIRYTENVKKRLLEHSELSEGEKSALKSRIHVVINTPELFQLKKELEREDAGTAEQAASL